MRIVAVTRLNRNDPNPWLVSDIHFRVIREWMSGEERMLTIVPYGDG